MRIDIRMYTEQTSEQSRQKPLRSLLQLVPNLQDKNRARENLLSSLRIQGKLSASFTLPIPSFRAPEINPLTI